MRKVSLFTATAVVIANMIGTGVFTSLGFQLNGIESVFAIIMIWLAGGVIALCGALSYGELASAMPRSGAEYHYLSVLMHPLVGLLSGWVSVTVGFAAPVALSAFAFGNYVNKVYPGLNTNMLAYTAVIVTTALHCFTLKSSARFQNISTLLKIVLILTFIVAGLAIHNHQSISLAPADNPVTALSWKSIFTMPFAVSLIYVSYSYSGWNASAYMAGDIKNPGRNIPRSLLAGTALVTVLYVMLNYVFLYSAPVSELKNQVEVGYISGIHIFGAGAGNFVSLMISLLMISSISSLVFAGPRVAQVMGEDIPALSLLSKTNRHGIPLFAILLQSAIALLLIRTSSFNAVILYTGFTLAIFTFLTVLSLFILRIWRKDLHPTYKTFGYPLTPLVFLTLNGWILYSTFSAHPVESLYGLGTALAGSILYFIQKKK